MNKILKALTALVTLTIFASCSSATKTTNTEDKKIKVIFFDVNETMLDLESMRDSVGKALGGRKELLPYWFSKMLHYSLVSTDIDNYQDFGKIGMNALLMVANENGIKLSAAEAKKAIVTPLLKLPPHSDVRGALVKLKAAGYKLVTLTNSSNFGVKTQMQNANLIEFFEERLSIEDIQVYKPNLKAYEWATKKMNVDPEDSLLVAAHGWDVAGAKGAGMKAAFVARPGKSLYPLSIQPDYVVKDFAGLVDILVKKESK